MLKLLKQKAKYLVLGLTDQDSEIIDIKSKYFTKADYSKFTNKKLDLKMKQKGLVDKADIAGFMNNANLDEKYQNQEQKLN